MVDGQLTCPDCREREVASIGIGYEAREAIGLVSRLRGLAGVVAAGLVIAVIAFLVGGVGALSSGAPALAGSSGNGSPIDLVQRHYSEIAAGRLDVAWRELSPSFQKQVDYTAWANSYAGSRIEPSGLQISAESPSSATVVGSATVTSSAGTSDVVQGQWTLRLIGGEWRLDSATFLTSVEAQR